jgi:hypothetical protein
MRALFLISLCVMLASCGFEPLHGRKYRQEQRLDLSEVEIHVDNSRRGQLLEAEIRDAVNPDYQAATKLYRLQISLRETEIALFIRQDGTSSRGDIILNSNYTLTRIADGEVVDTNTITRSASFNSSESADYASYVSEEDARKRAVVELAQDYKLRLANLLARLEREELEQAE